ncbi:MAG TPA: 50S ribosomal protein L25 [Chloroflexota bacterium]|nr:50S ribosomal protein L25 [Chloroflexota bacterium]
MADLVEIKASRRSVLGKKVKVLRREGQVPANVYGRQRDSVAVQLNDREIEHLLATHSRSQAIAVVVDGEQEPALISAVQRHPTRQHVLHVDFHRISMDQPVTVNVTLAFHGEAPAVRQHEAVIAHNLSEVMVHGLPGLIPSSIDVDVSSLEELDSSIFVRDLHVAEGLEIMTDPEELVARAMRPTVEAEEPVAEEEAEGEAAAPEAAAEQPETEAEA